jgi:hypothetical protein
MAATKGKLGDLDKSRVFLKCDRLESISPIVFQGSAEEEGLKNFNRTRD